MPTFVTLIRWTDQGVRTVKESTKRYREAEKLFQKMGIKTVGFYWTLGRYDAISIGEAPDDETVTAAALAIGSRGNVRTETLHAFSLKEMDRILKKVT